MGLDIDKILKQVANMADEQKNLNKQGKESNEQLQAVVMSLRALQE